MEGGAWQDTVHGVAKSRTRLSNFTLTFFFIPCRSNFKISLLKRTLFSVCF